MNYQLGPGPLQVDQNTIDEKIKGDIGIVENGDVATHAIPSGYYVIWKGDLYVAKTDISSGTTLSAASNGNLTAKTNGLGGEVAALNSNFNNIGAIQSVDISNTSVKRVYRYTVGSTVIIYGLVSFSSATAEISGLPTNGSGAYIPVSLFDTDAASTKFFNLNPNATAVSLSGLSTSHYYVLMCVYLMH